MLIVTDGIRRYLWEEGDLHTDKGVIKEEDLKSAQPGDIVRTHLGYPFVVLEPEFYDLFRTLRRGPQVILPKDSSFIIGLLGISDGWIVVEGGTGSGFMTVYLANAVRPNGKVITYEVRKDFLELAMENVKKMGLEKYVEFKNKSVFEMDESNVDAIILDIPNPWEGTHLVDRLRVGGFIVAYLPQILQVYKTAASFIATGKVALEGVYEIILRRWVLGDRVCRPEHMGLLHTGFICILRKVRRNEDRGSVRGKEACAEATGATPG